MKPYGWRRGMWRDKDGGPSSKHRKMTGKHRAESRRLMHKHERNEVKRNLRKEEENEY